MTSACSEPAKQGDTAPEEGAHFVPRVGCHRGIREPQGGRGRAEAWREAGAEEGRGPVGTAGLAHVRPGHWPEALAISRGLEAVGGSAAVTRFCSLPANWQGLLDVAWHCALPR